jgi:predicted dehydrogenase
LAAAAASRLAAAPFQDSGRKTGLHRGAGPHFTRSINRYENYDAIAQNKDIDAVYIC